MCLRAEVGVTISLYLPICGPSDSAPNQRTQSQHEGQKKSNTDCAEGISVAHVEFAILMWRDVARPPIEGGQIQSPGQPHQEQNRK